MDPVIMDHRGALVLPPDVFEALGLPPGTPFDAEVQDGKVVLTPRKDVLVA